MRRDTIRLGSLIALFAACSPPAARPDGGGGGADAAPSDTAQPALDAAAGGDGTSACDALGPTLADPAYYDAVVRCLTDPRTTDEAARGAIAGFVAAVESHDGFPIVDGARTIFVYVRDPVFDAEDDADPAEDYDPARRAEPIRVAGDFNGWTPGGGAGAQMQHAGHGFFHAVLALGPSGAVRWGYKLVARDGAGADVWFSDPLSRRFQYDSNGRISFVRGGGPSGHLEWIRGVRATRLGVARDIVLYVPRNYDQAPASTRYPVLYMHDGNNLFDVHQPRSAPASWDVDAVADAEIAAGNAREFIVVGVPNNDNRFGEYTPVTDVVSGSTVGGQGDDYVDFLVSDLKPLVDRRYRTATDRRSTAVLGSSLGGLISFYAGLARPEVFGLVGGMSSTFDWGASAGNTTVTARYTATADLASRAQVFYLDSGGGPATDGTCTFDGVGDPRDNYCETLEMRDALVAHGIRTFPDDPNAARLTPADIDIYHWWERDALHNESAWHARMFRPLRLFFRP